MNTNRLNTLLQTLLDADTCESFVLTVDHDGDIKTQTWTDALWGQNTRLAFYDNSDSSNKITTLPALTQWLGGGM